MRDRHSVVETGSGGGLGRRSGSGDVTRTESRGKGFAGRIRSVGSGSPGRPSDTGFEGVWTLGET